MRLGFVYCVMLPMADVAALGADWSDHPINEWVKRSPRDDLPAPPLKYEGSGAMDPASGNWIHFGGHDGIPQGFYLFTCDIGSGKWRQWFPNTSPPGVCCVDGSNTFDISQKRFVVLETVAADKSGPQIWTYRFAVRSDGMPVQPPLTLTSSAQSIG